jgi:hypothetical protein
MAHVPVVQLGYPSSGNLSADVFKFVEFSSGSIQVCNASSDVPVGVLQNKPSSSSQTASVMHLGVTKVVAGAAVSEGAKVQSNASGKAIALASGGHCAGVALQAAAGVDELIDVLLTPGGGPVAP